MAQGKDRRHVQDAPQTQGPVIEPEPGEVVTLGPGRYRIPGNLFERHRETKTPSWDVLFTLESESNGQRKARKP